VLKIRDGGKTLEVFMSKDPTNKIVMGINEIELNTLGIVLGKKEAAELGRKEEVGLSIKSSEHELVIRKYSEDYSELIKFIINCKFSHLMAFSEVQHVDSSLAEDYVRSSFTKVSPSFKEKEILRHKQESAKAATELSAKFNFQKFMPWWANDEKDSAKQEAITECYSWIAPRFTISDRLLNLIGSVVIFFGNYNMGVVFSQVHLASFTDPNAIKSYYSALADNSRGSGSSSHGSGGASVKGKDKKVRIKKQYYNFSLYFHNDHIQIEFVNPAPYSIANIPKYVSIDHTEFKAWKFQNNVTVSVQKSEDNSSFSKLADLIGLEKHNDNMYELTIQVGEFPPYLAHQIISENTLLCRRKDNRSKFNDTLKNYMSRGLQKYNARRFQDS